VLIAAAPCSQSITKVAPTASEVVARIGAVTTARTSIATLTLRSCWNAPLRCRWHAA